MWCSLHVDVAGCYVWCRTDLVCTCDSYFLPYSYPCRPRLLAALPAAAVAAAAASTQPVLLVRKHGHGRVVMVTVDASQCCSGQVRLQSSIRCCHPACARNAVVGRSQCCSGQGCILSSIGWHATSKFTLLGVRILCEGLQELTLLGFEIPCSVGGVAGQGC